MNDSITALKLRALANKAIAERNKDRVWKEIQKRLGL